MKTSPHRIILPVLLLALSLLVAGCAPTAAEPPAALSAALFEVSGTVQTLKPAEGLFRDASDGDAIAVKDQVLTHDNGRVRIDISNGTIVRVGPLTTFTLEDMDVNASGPFARFKLDIGELWIILNGGQVNVDTPAGLASVRGSYLNVIVRPDTGETIVTCLEGTCTLGNGGGTVTLTAGESARILNSSQPPETGKMDDQDVQRWLDANPEATLVVVPLTAAPNTPTPGPSATDDPAQPSPTTGAENSATTSATAIDCGPPDGWVIYTVKAGETLFGIGGAFQVSVPDLQKANCMGTSVAILAGQGLFVPNRPTVTPTITPTPVPTRTPVGSGNTATPTKTPKPTNTATPTVTPTATMSGSGSNANFISDTGPKGTVIGTCTNSYSVTVTDPDGINNVKLVYGINDPLLTSPTYINLPLIGTDTYGGNFEIPTFANAGADTVYYKFLMQDTFGWLESEPEPAYSYTDNLDCGGPQESQFTVEAAPANGSTIATCTNEYRVKVTDPQGVLGVYLEYAVNDPTFSTPFPYYYGLSYIGSETWQTFTSLDTETDGVASANDTVYWRFKAEDNDSNITFHPLSGSVNFIDPLDCTVP